MTNRKLQPAPVPPLLVEDEGGYREPFARLGQLSIDDPCPRRRRRSSLRKRRPSMPLRRRAGKLIRQALRVPNDHHRHYQPELVAQIPFAGGTTAAGLLAAIDQGGWRNARLERMRDVEWARSLQERPLLRPFEGVPLFAIVAEV